MHPGIDILNRQELYNVRFICYTKYFTITLMYHVKIYVSVLVYDVVALSA